MSNYVRVIPRDLFNEANLLKCMGQLCIALETAGPHNAAFAVDNVDVFDIRQSSDDGSISVENLPFMIGADTYRLARPLNSRQPWPLWLSNDSDSDFEPIEVFDDCGKLSAAMLSLISNGATQ